MARNQPLAPRARVSAENPSGSFTVSWLSGGDELAGGYYYVRIAPMVDSAGNPNQPFLPPNILIAEYTASAHVEASPGAHEYTFSISQSAQYDHGIRTLGWSEGVWPLSESRTYEVQVNSDSGAVGTKDTWLPSATVGITTGSMAFTTSASIATAPSAPTIAFGSSTSGSVTFTWSDVATATNYKHYYGTSTSPTSPGHSVGDVNTYTVTGSGTLPAGTTHYFRLKATNDEGDSDYSNQLTIATPTVQPDAPTISRNTYDKNYVDFTKPTGTYITYINANSSSATIGTQIAGSPYVNSITHSVDPGSTWYYFMRTATQNANSQFSQWSDASSAAASPVATASAPTIAFNAKTTSAITVSWSSVASASNYKYYIAETANPTVPGTATGDVTSYQSASLSAGTDYYIRVKSTNAGGDSDYSNELHIDTLTATISDLTLSDNKPTRNDIAWTSPTGTANSYLYGDTNSTPTTLISTQTGTGGETFEHTGLTPGSTYYYRVRTQTTNHDSQYSAYSSTSNQANPAVTAPTSLGYTAETHSINFDFTEPANYGERVYIYDTSGNQQKQTGDDDWIVVNASGDSDWDTSGWTDESDAVLINGGNQSLTVKYKGYYDGQYSSFTSTVTGYSLPAYPTSLSATAVSDSQINLSWTNPTGSALSETFTIQRKPSGGTYSDLTTSATGTSHADNDNLDASTQYYYKIKTVTSAGSSVYTSEVNATTQAGASVPANANLSLGALGKAVGANGDTTSETALAADGRGSTGTTTRIQDFTTSAVSSMTVPDDTVEESTSAVATIAFANVGNLFLTRIANRAANFTWDEYTNTSLYVLNEAAGNYTSSIDYTGDGSISFRAKFNDGFNDHATNYNNYIVESVTISDE